MKRLALLWLVAGCATPGPWPDAAKVVAAPPVTWVPAPVPGPLEPLPRTRPEAATRTLRNGLKVVVVEDHRARLVRTRLFFSNGSATETDERAGATYFALALLGDRFDAHDADGRPVVMQEKSARYLSMARGWRLRFDVAPDVAWLGIDAHARDTDAVLRELDALGTKRRHGDESFQDRSQAAVDALNEMELTDGTVLGQYLAQLAFGADHPYARSIYGTAASLSRLGLEEIVERQAELLTPVGTTLLVAGDVQRDEVFRWAERSFGDWKATPAAKAFVKPPQVTRRRGVVFLPRKPSRNTLVCLTRPLTDVPGTPAVAQLAVDVLGELRISNTLREEFGLTYSVNTQVFELRAARALSICTRVRSTETATATRLMLEAFASFGANPPTSDELEHARAMLVSERETAQDDLEGIVEAWRQAVVRAQGAPSTTEVAELRAVTLSQVAAAAKLLASRDAVQVILSGEKATAEGTAQANGLGALKVPTLQRVEE